jgi:hypothetical protein
MLGMELEGTPTGEWKALLEQLKQLETRFSGVELIGSRADGVDSNDIVESLIEYGRDFFSSDQQLADDVAQAMADEIERRSQAAMEKGRPDPSDDVLASSGLMAAMKVYMVGVLERIDAQRTATGGGPQALTDKYAAYKNKRWGFTTPIGKASGQLLSALTPGGSAAGKIQLIRR